VLVKTAVGGSPDNEPNNGLTLGSSGARSPAHFLPAQRGFDPAHSLRAQAVMRGFIEGLVCVTIIGQVPHLLGISGTSGNFFTKLSFVLVDASFGVFNAGAVVEVYVDFNPILASVVVNHIADIF
jgi:hypothetical protein